MQKRQFIPKPLETDQKKSIEKYKENIGQNFPGRMLFNK